MLAPRRPEMLLLALMNHGQPHARPGALNFMMGLELTQGEKFTFLHILLQVTKRSIKKKKKNKTWAGVSA